MVIRQPLECLGTTKSWEVDTTEIHRCGRSRPEGGRSPPPGRSSLVTAGVARLGPSAELRAAANCLVMWSARERRDHARHLHHPTGPMPLEEINRAFDLMQRRSEQSAL